MYQQTSVKVICVFASDTRYLFSLWNFGVKLTMQKLDSWGYPPVTTVWS